ncbi:MAG TPA: glycosyltransferase family 39 protein [Candidatus Aquilonibacter sp.]|nr:glycosyltransferase family 39 protein [Candidatus Aquilonibacter sp.]
MPRFFTRERFGRPQLWAGLLLLAFFLEAAWLVRSELHGSAGPDLPEQVRITAGWRQWHGGAVAGAPLPDDRSYPGEISHLEVSKNGFDTEHSPLVYLVTAAPLLPLPARVLDSGLGGPWLWFPRLPFLACGVLLGASLWYVARRLCGNTGGYIALTLYCFSPSMVKASAVWHTEPEIIAAWGAFGTIFTAIAVAHTLYAPREVVLWNWRRILLLGIALALAVGSQFSMVIVVPLALIFLLYVAPVRRKAGLAIWLAAVLVGGLLLFSFYFFHPRIFWEGMTNAMFWAATSRGFAILGVYRQVLAETAGACPAMVFLFPLAAVTYVLWPRTRYFGNTAPLLIGLGFVTLGIAHPHTGGAGFLLGSLPFLFIFVSGVTADLLETRHRQLIAAGIWGVLAAYAVWSLMGLAKVSG